MRAVFPLSLFSLIVPLSLGCSGDPADAGPSARSDSEILAVDRGRFERVMPLTGELVAEDAVVLAAPNAKIWPLQLRWLAEDGIEVEAGDPVVEFDNAQLVSNLEEQRARVVEETHRLASLEARLAADLSAKLSELHRQRAELEKAQLLADVPGDLLAEQELARRRLDLERAELQVAKLEQQLAAQREAGHAELEIQRIALAEARTEVARAESGIELLTLRAPRDGILVLANHPREDRPFQEGDSVWPGLVLARLPKLATMLVEARLYEVDDGRVRAGESVEAVLDAFPEQIFAGRVREVDRMALEAGRGSTRRYFRVRIDLETVDPELMRPGMSVKVLAREPARDDVLLIPRRSLHWDAAGPRARLADGSWTALTLGPCNATVCVLEAGLEEGTRLAAATAF